MRIVMHPGPECYNQDFDYDTVPTLFYADVFCGQVIRHNGQEYVVCIVSSSKNFAAVEKVKIDKDPEDKLYKCMVTCPACGHQNNDSWELSDSDDSYECGQCGAVLSYERLVTVEYSTRLVSMPEITEIGETQHGNS